MRFLRFLLLKFTSSNLSLESGWRWIKNISLWLFLFLGLSNCLSKWFCFFSRFLTNIRCLFLINCLFDFHSSILLRKTLRFLFDDWFFLFFSRAWFELTSVLTECLFLFGRLSFSFVFNWGLLLNGLSLILSNSSCLGLWLSSNSLVLNSWNYFCHRGSFWLRSGCWNRFLSWQSSWISLR